MNARYHNGWTRCPPGELTELATRLRWRAWYYRAVVALALVAATALSAFSAVKLATVLSPSPSSAPLAPCASPSDCAQPSTSGCGSTPP